MTRLVRLGSVSVGRSGAVFQQGLRRTIGHELSNVFYHLDRLCIGVRPRVLVIQAVDIGHEEEDVGVHHGGRDGRQCVIVAKLDFRYGQRIVFIDDGDDTHVKELMDSVLSIEVP